MKMEIQFRSIRPDAGAVKETIEVDGQLGIDPAAVKAGDLLWISSQFAGNAQGLVTAPDASSQVDFIFPSAGGYLRGRWDNGRSAVASEGIRLRSQRRVRRI